MHSIERCDVVVNIIPKLIVNRLYLCSFIIWAMCVCGLGECCRISPSCFLAKCQMRRLNQASFVLLCYALFAFSGLYLVCVVICLL